VLSSGPGCRQTGVPHKLTAPAEIQLALVGVRRRNGLISSEMKFSRLPPRKGMRGIRTATDPMSVRAVSSLRQPLRTAAVSPSGAVRPERPASAFLTCAGTKSSMAVPVRPQGADHRRRRRLLLLAGTYLADRGSGRPRWGLSDVGLRSRPRAHQCSRASWPNCGAGAPNQTSSRDLHPRHRSLWNSPSSGV